MPAELILFYITCIRSILEYACPVFHRAFPGYLSEDLERLQKRALRIIYPGMSYNQALEFSSLPTLFKRREEISSKLFNEVVGDPGHTLHKLLLPSKNPANYFLRRNRNFALPLCKTNRCKKIFHFQSRFLRLVVFNQLVIVAILYFLPFYCYILYTFFFIVMSLL